MSVAINGTNGITYNDGSLQPSAPVGRNLIINGDMAIDQRNVGASVATGAGAFTYTLDRYFYYASQASKYTVQQNAGAVTPPAGFTKYLGVTSTSAYSIVATDIFIVGQKIEGLNIADLGWGTANAKTVTLSFQVYSSLTGTFGGSLQNGAANRAYPFTYTIDSANTWTSISVTIAGDTSGTWLTTNGIGIYVNLGLGVGSTYSGSAGSWSANQYWSATGATSVVGTSGATFYATGLQLEANTTATPFEHLQYTTQLQLCQRYFEKSYSIGSPIPTGTALGSVSLFTSYSANSYMVGSRPFVVSKRAAPTIIIYSPSGTAGTIADGNTTNLGAGAANQIGTAGFALQNTSGGVITPAGNLIYFHFTASAEL